MADKKKKFTYIPREDKRTNPEVRLDNTFPPTLISSPNQSIEELISLYNQGFLTSDDAEEGTYSTQGFPVRSLLQNESISTPPVFPEDRAPAPMHTLPYSIEDIRQVGHVPEVQSLLRSVEHQPEVARTQRWSDHHDRTSGVSAEARQADAEQARDRYPYTSFKRDIERDYQVLSGNNWTIDELLELREEDPEAFSLLMDEYFFSNLRVPGRSSEVERKFFENKKELEYYGSPPGTMMKLPGHDHDPFEGYPIREGMARGVADDWYNTVYDRVGQKQLEEHREKESRGMDTLSFGNPVEDFKRFQARAMEEGYTIVYGTTPKKGKASFVRHNEKTIYFDPFLAREKYREKAWKFPKLPGVKPLEDRHFPTERSWFDFLHEHELAHLKLKRKKNESTADYENRINKYALDFLEVAKGSDDLDRWDNIEGALRTVMGAGPRLLGGLGMALWPTSTVSQEEEDRQLRMHGGD